MYKGEKKKEFRIIIYGVADYDPNSDSTGSDEFVTFVNRRMKEYLLQLQNDLANKVFTHNSTLRNCEILGHGNKDYPTIT